MLTDQLSHQTRTRTSFSYLLSGLMFDDTGHRMAPTQAQKKCGRYSYYVSRPLLFRNAATVNVGVRSLAYLPLMSTIRFTRLFWNRSTGGLKATDPINSTFACSMIERIQRSKNAIAVAVLAPVTG